MLALSDGEQLLEAVSTDDGAKEGVLVVLDKNPLLCRKRAPGGQTPAPSSPPPPRALR